MSGDGRGVYLYALLRSAPVNLEGLSGVADAGGVRTITYGDLGLVVSDVSLGALDLPEDELSEKGRLATYARAHDEVVRRLFEQTAVLPLRLATVVADDEAAVRILADSAPRAIARLAALEGHREWAVRLQRQAAAGGAHGQRGEEKASANGTSASGSERPSGRAYLQRRRDELRAAREERYRDQALLEDAHHALSAHASETTRHSPGGSDVVLNAAFLVPLRAEDAFLAEADNQAGAVAADGFTLNVIGPWPPYSFAAFDSEEKAHV